MSTRDYVSVDTSPAPSPSILCLFLSGALLPLSSLFTAPVRSLRPSGVFGLPWEGSPTSPPCRDGVGAELEDGPRPPDAKTQIRRPKHHETVPSTSFDYTSTSPVCPGPRLPDPSLGSGRFEGEPLLRPTIRRHRRQRGRYLTSVVMTSGVFPCPCRFNPQENIICNR